MENRFQTSFMPKRPVVGGGPEPIRRKSPPSFLLIVGVVIFIFTISVFGGLWWYQGSIAKSNDLKKQKIEEEIKNFEPELTRELTAIKTKMDSGRQLLANHIAFSTLLGFLESITSKTVRFTEMVFSASPDPVSREMKMSISLKGEAESYVSVAFQSDLFGKNENIRNPIFSDLNLNERGYVSFAVKADIVPTSILYKNTISPVAPIAPENLTSPENSGSPATTGASGEMGAPINQP